MWDGGDLEAAGDEINPLDKGTEQEHVGDSTWWWTHFAAAAF
jgi:hypothetical protein